MYYVYILRSLRTDKYYVGYTNDLVRRLKNHNEGTNKSTKHGVPWEVIYQEELLDRKSAWMREKQIKSYKGGEAFKKLIV